MKLIQAQIEFAATEKKVLEKAFEILSKAEDLIFIGESSTGDELGDARASVGTVIANMEGLTLTVEC